MLLISDLHLTEDSADTVLNQVLPGIRAVSRETGDKHVAILGDVFHFRYQVPVKLLNGLRDALIAGAFDGVQFTILPGNHDQVDVEGRNALEHLHDLKHVTVYNEPTWDDHGLWFPYRKTELVAHLLHENWAEWNDNHAKVCFIHQGIRGAMMNDNFANTDGLNINLFDSFEMVICGHYHKHQYIGENLAYVGSPYQTKADEAGQPKGYCTWDGKKLTHHPMDWGKRYHHIGEHGEIDLENIRAGDEVRGTLPVGSTMNLEELAKQFQAMGVSHVISVEQEKLQNRLEVQDGAGLSAFAHAFVDAVDTPLDKERLIKTFRELTS